MNTAIMLDTAAPPALPLWLADARAVDAGAVGIYAEQTVDGGTAYTPAHVTAALAAGLRVLPIIVPYTSPIATPDQMLDSVAALGLMDGPVALDLETNDTYPSLPPPAWVSLWAQVTKRRGYLPVVYANPSDHAAYASLGLPWWEASYGTRTAWRPAPPTPLLGTVGWQYIGTTAIGHGTYDVSMVDVDALWPVPRQTPAAPPNETAAPSVVPIIAALVASLLLEDTPMPDTTNQGGASGAVLTPEQWKAQLAAKLADYLEQHAPTSHAPGAVVSTEQQLAGVLRKRPVGA